MEKLLINSLPKAGTHLLVKLVESFGYKDSRGGIAATLLLGKYYLVRQIIRGSWFEKNPVIIGMDLPVAISKRWMNKKFSQLPVDYYVFGHANYSDHLFSILEKNNIKTIQIIRDPRDVLLSYVHYVAKTPSHFIYDFYKDLSFDERLRFTLQGGEAGNLYMESFPTMLKQVDGWFNKKDVLVVKFEDLIGSQGGGDDDLQKSVITSIVEFLKIESVDIDLTAKNLFGGTHTFRKGRIGTWQEELSEEQIQLVRSKIDGTAKRWGYEV